MFTNYTNCLPAWSVGPNCYEKVYGVVAKFGKSAAVIGGTSLFGGRGSAWSALLGIIVIQSISNGLTLLNLPSSLRYIITGAVLAQLILRGLQRRLGLIAR